MSEDSFLPHFYIQGDLIFFEIWTPLVKIWKNIRIAMRNKFWSVLIENIIYVYGIDESYYFLGTYFLKLPNWLHNLWTKI